MKRIAGHMILAAFAIVVISGTLIAYSMTSYQYQREMEAKGNVNENYRAYRDLVGQAGADQIIEDCEFKCSVDIARCVLGCIRDKGCAESCGSVETCKQTCDDTVIT